MEFVLINFTVMNFVKQMFFKSESKFFHARLIKNCKNCIQRKLVALSQISQTWNVFGIHRENQSIIHAKRQHPQPSFILLRQFFYKFIKQILRNIGYKKLLIFYLKKGTTLSENIIICRYSSKWKYLMLTIGTG